MWDDCWRVRLPKMPQLKHPPTLSCTPMLQSPQAGRGSLRYLGAVYRRQLDPLLSKGYSCQKSQRGASHMPTVGR